MFDQMQLVDLRSTAVRTAGFKVEPTSTAKKDFKKYNDVSGNKSIENTLSQIFPTKRDENNLQRARRMLGDIAIDLSDQELEPFLTQFEGLLDSWLDEFEKKIFDNKTLIQLLKEG